MGNSDSTVEPSAAILDTVEAPRTDWAKSKIPNKVDALSWDNCRASSPTPASRRPARTTTPITSPMGN
eukprot:4520185-Pyramimonas_sp.AAC.1